MCLQDYVNEVRVERSANLLMYSDESLSMIAEYVNFPSQSYFGKVFKSITGQSPQRFLISFRMERAAAELTASNAPIGDVGASVGYTNLLHFSRAFKGVYGMSPREYRQQYKKQTRREAIQ